MAIEGQRFPTISDVEADFKKQKEKSKEEAGGAAFTLWVIFGIYLFWTVDGAHFLSWQAAAYFIPGGFFAALLFGGVFYTIACGLVRMTRGLKWDARRAANSIGSLVILAVQWTSLFFTAKIVLGRLVAMHL